MKSDKATIMVVEDDEDICEALAELLVENGFEALTASNGAEALERIRTHTHVRAIILDVTMPVMNGATFRGEQLADPRIADIPLVLLTGRSDISALTGVLKPAACLQKPVVEAELLRALDRYR